MNLTAIPAGILLVGLCVAGDHLPFWDTVTVYQVQCSGGSPRAGCTSEATLKPVTFKVLPDLQRVVYWTDQTLPKRLRHCAIRNLHNWSCAADDISADAPKHNWQMLSGHFDDVEDAAQIVSDRIQVSKWHWWWVWLKERF